MALSDPFIYFFVHILGGLESYFLADRDSLRESPRDLDCEAERRRSSFFSLASFILWARSLA